MAASRAISAVAELLDVVLACLILTVHTVITCKHSTVALNQTVGVQYTCAVKREYNTHALEYTMQI